MGFENNLFSYWKTELLCFVIYFSFWLWNPRAQIDLEIVAGIHKYFSEVLFACLHLSAIMTRCTKLIFLADVLRSFDFLGWFLSALFFWPLCLKTSFDLDNLRNEVVGWSFLLQSNSLNKTFIRLISLQFRWQNWLCINHLSVFIEYLSFFQAKYDFLSRFLCIVLNSKRWIANLKLTFKHLCFFHFFLQMLEFRWGIHIYCPLDILQVSNMCLLIMILPLGR